MKVIEKIKSKKPEVHHGDCITLAFDIFGKSPSDLAEKLGITRQHIQRIKETKKIGASRLEAIAEFFEISIDELLDITNKPVTKMIKYQSESVIDYLEREYPKHPKYLRQMEELQKEVMKITSMLEK